MMTKWLVRLSFPALGLLLLLIFFGLKEPELASEPVAEDSDHEIPAFEGLVPSPVPTDGPDIVFKWQDTEGNWHYADQPPAQGPWNTLAIERPEQNLSPNVSRDPDTDWQSPYHAPFSLGPTAGSNGS
ncbi:MAG: DUF4124 domain-containing protein [Gammaproteobacteria bacterium]|uniref:DUF4124 domain-containing protein n=1 Tax=Marinobacter nitratireducens TaxID=1137280 RepID=A0A072NAX9_9GAMM|nr:hypothetical protein [Marinobacter nitratireducens]KEF30215.1 hypothetical protein D777_03391 [Marinobacter nitratireducens]TNE73692.1 MAG: DUF4124 domain-containing protein [Gammaproteobacteria bacterium]TNE98504.1 MAG: DUF4124 domain-containing protein [Gammaproteobacteria bacterium]